MLADFNETLLSVVKKIASVATLDPYYGTSDICLKTVTTKKACRRRKKYVIWPALEQLTLRRSPALTLPCFFFLSFLESLLSNLKKFFSEMGTVSSSIEFCSVW